MLIIEKILYFLYAPKKELDFLKLITSKKITYSEFAKYEWEIKVLSAKYIFSLTDFNIYDEVLESVKDAILDIDNGKIYMVKGIRADIDEILKDLELPQFVSTTLLMYKDTIVFNSQLYVSEIKFGNDVKEYVVKEMEKAMKYYHL